MKYLLWAVIGYLAGGLLFARIIPRLFRGIDVTVKSDDGNPGAANAFRYAGTAVGVLTLLFELAKGALPVFFAAHVLDAGSPAFALVLAAPCLGHAFPLGRPGQGGKAIAAAFGALLGLLPLWQPLILLAGLYIFFSVVVVVSPHLFRSILTFGLFAAGCFFLALPWPVAAGCCVIAATVICKHFLKYKGEKPVLRLFKSRA